MEIATAQLEVRRAYLRGGPGAMVSGIVWLVSGIVANANGVPVGFAALFFAGMLIFPIATFIVRNLFGCDRLSPANPNGVTVVETIFPMIGGLLAAWLLIPCRPEVTFPMAAIAVGAHYFGFRTAYGDWTNWILGGTLCTVGASAVFYGLPVQSVFPYVVAAIELVFGGWFTWISLSRDYKVTPSICTATMTGQGKEVTEPADATRLE